MSKSFNEIIKSMKEIVNAASTKVVEKIDTRVSALEEKMDSNHKEILARLASIEDHIVQPAQKCGAPKNVNTVQYNGIADRLEPIGKCMYRGKEVNYFGICSKCGQPIIQPSPVAYCIANKLDITCYTCQKGGTHKHVAEFLPGDPNAKNGKTPVVNDNNSTDQSIVMNCEICGKPRRYKNALDYLEKTKEAQKHGFPKVMCSCCAKAKVAELKAQTQQAEQSNAQYVPYGVLLDRCDRTPEVGGHYKHMLKALEDCTVGDDVVTEHKRGLYNAIKDVARAVQMELKMNVALDDVKAVYGELVKRAESLVHVVDDVVVESNDNGVEGLSVDDVIVHILTSTNLSAEEIIALKFKDIKELIFEEEIEIAFNGNDWNRGKKRAVELDAQLKAACADVEPVEVPVNEQVEEQVEVPTQAPIQEQVTNIEDSPVNYGF